MNKCFYIGYYGIPGGASGGKTHIKPGFENAPVCRTRISPDAEFQWCFTPSDYDNARRNVECLRCKAWALHAENRGTL